MKLYAAPTPNCWRAAIMLEEVGLPYTVVPIDIGLGRQYEAAFKKISPLAKVPVLEDETSRIFLYGSTAIVLHLAERAGKLLPTNPVERAAAIEWALLGASDFAPTSSVIFVHDVILNEKSSTIRDFYIQEFDKVLNALEARLAGRDYLAGPYSIADIVCYPYCKTPLAEGRKIFDERPRLGAWAARMAARPAVQKGMKVAT